MRPLALHLAAETPAASLWTPPFVQALEEIVRLEIHINCAAWPQEKLLEMCRSAPILLTGWGAVPLPAALAMNPGELRYICHLTGTLRSTVPLEMIRAGVSVTNWGEVPAAPVAEGALTLLLACVHNLRPHIEEKRQGGWIDYGWLSASGSLRGLRLGLYGFGAIGRHFSHFAQALGARVRVLDPYLQENPPGVERVHSLEALCEQSDALSVHVALTEETRHSITARHLALLPDGGIVINTARGPIFDEEALFAELMSGRLRAGLDVLSTDEAPMPMEHPVRQLPNVILTGHKVSAENWPPSRLESLQPLHEVALENLRAFLHRQPLKWQMDEIRYLRST